MPMYLYDDDGQLVGEITGYDGDGIPIYSATDAEGNREDAHRPEWFACDDDYMTVASSRKPRSRKPAPSLDSFDDETELN